MSEKDLKARLHLLQRKPENQTCCDCGDKFPTWASLMVPPSDAPDDCPTLGMFCCMHCSGLHRGLGTHICFVRSVNLDSWKESEVVAMEAGGNRVLNTIFEAKTTLVNAHKIDATANVKERERYIQKKYIEKSFYNSQPLVDLVNKLKSRPKGELSTKIRRKPGMIRQASMPVITETSRRSSMFCVPKKDHGVIDISQGPSRMPPSRTNSGSLSQTTHRSTSKKDDLSISWHPESPQKKSMKTPTVDPFAQAFCSNAPSRKRNSRAKDDLAKSWHPTSPEFDGDGFGFDVSEWGMRDAKLSSKGTTKDYSSSRNRSSRPAVTEDCGASKTADGRQNRGRQSKDGGQRSKRSGSRSRSRSRSKSRSHSKSRSQSKSRARKQASRLNQSASFLSLEEDAICNLPAKLTNASSNSSKPTTSTEVLATDMDSKVSSSQSMIKSTSTYRNRQRRGPRPGGLSRAHSVSAISVEELKAEYSNSRSDTSRTMSTASRSTVSSFASVSSEPVGDAEKQRTRRRVQRTSSDNRRRRSTSRKRTIRRNKSADEIVLYSDSNDQQKANNGTAPTMTTGKRVGDSTPPRNAVRKISRDQQKKEPEKRSSSRSRSNATSRSVSRNSSRTGSSASDSRKSRRANKSGSSEGGKVGSDKNAALGKSSAHSFVFMDDDIDSMHRMTEDTFATAGSSYVDSSPAFIDSDGFTDFEDPFAPDFLPVS